MIYTVTYWSWYQYLKSGTVKNATADVSPSKDDWLVVFQPYDLQRRSIVSAVIDKFDYSKRVLVHYEGRYLQPHGFKLRYQQQFGRIYTYNSTDVDGDTVKYMPIPLWITEEECHPIGNRPKFFCIVATNCGWKGEPKGKIIQNFKSLGMDVYGLYAQHVSNDMSYHKREDNTAVKYLPRYSAKVKMLSEYLFSLAIENQLDLGYVTEKLFDIIAAGCIPVYLGATDVSMFIPKSCYIDYRDFWSETELMSHLKRMSSREVKSYQSAIMENQKILIGMRTYESCMRFLCKDLGFECEAPYYGQLIELSTKLASRTIK